MERRSVGLAVVAALLVVVSVQIADPRLEDREPPEVDFSDPPADIAADAAKRFEYVDYAYRLDIKYGDNPNWRQVRMLRVDNSDREFYKEGPLGPDGVIMYGTEDVTYVRPAGDEPWRVTGDREVIFPVQVISQPFLVNRVQDSNATLVGQNATFTIIDLDVHPVKVASRYPGNATFVINKESGLVERATITYATPSGPKYLEFRLLDTEIDIDQPGDLPIFPRAIVWDVVRGPLVEL